MGDDPAEGFWTWSLDRYARAEPQLLQLQDRLDFNVNILLWCLWCAERFEQIPDLAMKKAVDITDRWRRDVTGALRTTRRALKSPPRQADAEAAAVLREKVKLVELDAEKIEQGMLARLAADVLKPSAGASVPVTARRNLATYAATVGAARRDGFSVALLDDLAKRIFGADAADLDRG